MKYCPAFFVTRTRAEFLRMQTPHKKNKNDNENFTHLNHYKFRLDPINIKLLIRDSLSGRLPKLISLNLPHMAFKGDLFKKIFAKELGTGVVESINDLRDKEFSGTKLSPEERFALSTFDNYRLKVLNAQENETVFHQQYRQLQVIANLSDWREFLKEEYTK